MQNRFIPVLEKIESNNIICAVRSGLSMAIPVLLTGSAALLLKTFLSSISEAYSITWLGFFENLFSMIYDATFGILSLYMVTFISLSYINIIKKTGLFIYGAPIASCAGFIIPVSYTHLRLNRKQTI